MNIYEYCEYMNILLWIYYEYYEYLCIYAYTRVRKQVGTFQVHSPFHTCLGLPELSGVF